MWEAIKKSVKLVNKDGYYYIAIYNKVGGRLGSRFWLRIKRYYNSSSLLEKRALEALYLLGYFSSQLKGLRNPLLEIRSYQLRRGMDFKTDVRDWLGGYPYEFATVEEVFRFMKTNFPELSLVNIRTTNGLGNNSYLFIR
jgi:2-polyprenyl-6-hydroxyphenyl methylase/3-demethylubiquinone-9 3-methyltransferase